MWTPHSTLQASHSHHVYKHAQSTSTEVTLTAQSDTVLLTEPVRRRKTHSACCMSWKRQRQGMQRHLEIDGLLVDLDPCQGFWLHASHCLATKCAKSHDGCKGASRNEWLPQVHRGLELAWTGSDKHHKKTKIIVDACSPHQLRILSLQLVLVLQLNFQGLESAKLKLVPQANCS